MPTILSRLRGLPPAISPDEPLRKNEAGQGAGGGVNWVAIPEGISLHSLTLDDTNNGVYSEQGIPVTVQIPLHEDVPIVVGSSVLFEQRGTGKLNFVQATGVTLDVRSVFEKTTAGQFAPATLIKTGKNRWLLSGDLEIKI